VPEKVRCGWARATDPLYLAYHDQEWGVPVHDDRTLFEFLVLEGAQAGLSWRTILGKRARYRQVFARFDPRRVARFGARDVTRLLADPGIVRNRLKVVAAVANARAVLATQRSSAASTRICGPSSAAPRSEPGGRCVPCRRRRQRRGHARDLVRRGFRFVGPTICYAFMQATVMVNDHTLDCFRHRQLARGG
jgi:DNA-3-methyladenine glycosylase I